MEQNDAQRKFQPPLHLFCIQNQAISPHSKNQPLVNKKLFNKRTFKSQIKIAMPQKSTHRYQPIKLLKANPNPNKPNNQSSGSFSQRHDTENSITILQNSANDAQDQRYSSRKADDMHMTLKITNMNKSFYYNLKEKKSKKFSYRESPDKYFKKFSRKLHEKASMHPISNNKFRIKTEESKQMSVRESVNLQKSNGIKGNQKLNFLDFLIDYNKKQRIANSLVKKEGLETTLTRLVQVPRPEMLKMSLKSQTQR